MAIPDESARVGGFLDWDSAHWWAGTLTPAGPTVTKNQAQRVATRLREVAAQAPGVVAAVTGLHEASQVAESYARLVVDRRGWAKANVEMFARMTDNHLPKAPNVAVQQGAALELGGLLGVLSTRVLGQFDPFTSRLLLVAPNIVNTRRLMGVDEEQFAAWVALHEQTHAVQFAAAPWLPGFLEDELAYMLDSMGQDYSTRVWQMARRLPSSICNHRNTTGGILTDAVLSTEEIGRLQKVVAVMSMLEGHADVVMDSAREFVPHTAAIRASFTKRRVEPGVGELVLRKLIGLDAKLRQYRDGAAFVNGVVAQVGHQGFNRVFDDPAHLPTPEEIAAPQLWVDRVGR